MVFLTVRKSILLTFAAVLGAFALSVGSVDALAGPKGPRKSKPGARAGAPAANATAVAGNAAGNAAGSVEMPKLGAPLITKLDWETRSVTPADLDGDGRTDLAVLNNDTGRIELLYQRKPGDPLIKKRAPRTDRWTPELEDALFRRESIAGDAGMLALEVADFDGDGLPDLALTSERRGLAIIFQGPKKGEWREPLRDFSRHVAKGDGTLLAIAEPDGTHLLVQRCMNSIAIFRFPKRAADAAPIQRLPEPKILRAAPFAGDVPFYQKLRAGKDAPFALGIQGGQNGDLLLFRERDKDGSFGPEVALRVEAGYPLLDEPLAPGVFLTLDAARKTISETRFVDDPRPLAGAERATARAYVFDEPLANAAQAVLFDADGDGRPDLVVAAPKAAKLLVRRALQNGDFSEPAEFPTLADVTTLAPVAYTAAGKKSPTRALLAISEKEGIIGIINFDAKGVPAFPAPVKIEGKALLAASSADGAFTVLLVKDDTGKTSFQRLVQDAAKNTWKTELLAAVQTTRRDITALKIADLDGDGLPDILAFVERDAARIWTQKRSAPNAPALPVTFTERAANSPFRKSVLDGATPANVTITTLDNKPHILVASPGYIRALTLNSDDDTLAVAFQANSTNAGEALLAPLLNGKTLIALASVRAGAGNTAAAAGEPSIVHFERDAAGTFREKERQRFSLVAPLTAFPASDSLLYLGTGALFQTSLTRRGLRAESRRVYESDLANFTPNGFILADFSGKPKKSAIGKNDGFKNAARSTLDSIVLFDPNQHIVEIARRTKATSAGGAGGAAQWRSAMHFVLFSENPHYRGRRGNNSQPREAFSCDLTGDGLDDLLLLMHDRILIYPQYR